MKQVKTSVLFAMLCVLIGYFEPANAAKISKSMTMKAPSAATAAYTALNSTTTLCPFWPNPIAPTATLTAVSYETITSATVSSTGGSWPVSVIAYNQPFPLEVVENNAYFVPDLWPLLTGTTLGLPALTDGNYTLTVKTSNGKTYTTKLSISSK
jgi:hypothetical protein